MFQIFEMDHLSAQLAKHLREVFFGGNWTCSNLKDQLKDVTYIQANQQVNSCNTIISLTYHIQYYVQSILQVMNGGALDSKDIYSYDHPKMDNQKQWEEFQQSIWSSVESLASQIELMPNENYQNIFVDEKYGNYFRNILGLIEHTHYHLGQLALLKKFIN